MDFQQEFWRKISMTQSPGFSINENLWKSVYQADDSEAAEDDEPEPEEDVDLLVDDVDRQDANRVVSLNCARRTVLTIGKTKTS